MLEIVSATVLLAFACSFVGVIALYLVRALTLLISRLQRQEIQEREAEIATLQRRLLVLLGKQEDVLDKMSRQSLYFYPRSFWRGIAKWTF